MEEKLNKKLFNTIKAQVTAFILVGILIIAIVWGALYISEYFAKKDMEKFAPIGHQLTLESDTIKENIDNCIQSLTDKGMQLMSDQGLYLEIPEDYNYDENYAYWLKNTINIMPSSFEKIDQDLAYYINSNLPTCANLDEFKENGWDISQFLPFTTIQINKEDMSIEVRYTIDVKKQDFERQFSNSIYNPKIRFRQIYGKSVDFINTQLLRPDFDFNNPLENYDASLYKFEYERLDNQTLLFSIIDSQSKILDGKPFTLKFAADFSINNISRMYDVSNSHKTRILLSPDRLAVLILQPGIVSSSDKITISQYKKDFVVREQTPHIVVNDKVTEYVDATFPTRYPIYQFNPPGTNFSTPAILTIFLNKDQQDIPTEYSLLYNGQDGWIPYPYTLDRDTGAIGTMVFGFSDWTVIACEDQNSESHSAIAEEERSTWAFLTPILAVAAIIVLALVTFGAGGIFGAGLFAGAQTAGATLTILGINTGIAASSLATVGLTINAALAYEAYGMGTEEWNLGDNRSITIKAKCNTNITVLLEEEDGECECSVFETPTQTPAYSPSGDIYTLEGGKMYTVAAVLTNFTWPNTEATCKCTAEGLITTNMAYKPPEPPPPPPPPQLVCCITYDGYCLDNYLDEECNGNKTQRTCLELTECSGEHPLSGEGNLNIQSLEGDPQGFGKEGDSFLISYYIQSASENTLVIAHIKKDETVIDSITLYDDGAHDDETANDKYYANTWRSRNTLGNQNSAELTWDVEVRYGNIRTEINKDVDSITLIDANSDCESMNTFSPENSLDIILAGNYYNNMDEFSPDLESSASKIIRTSAFSQYHSEHGINFFKIKELFSTSSLSQIKSQAISKCDYSDSPKKLIISLNNDATICKQEPNIVELNPLFAFKSGIPNVNSVLQDFCGQVNELNLMNPPEAEIITENIVTIPGDVEVEFKITDEEYPVNYELLWNYIPRKSGQVHDDSPKTHTILNLPNGDWIVQIKAIDQRGSVGYSEVLSITINDTMVMDLSSISPLEIPSGGLEPLDLNDAVYDPANDPITAWTYSPAFSECVSISESGGQFTITHIKDSSCSLTVTFEAIGTNNRRVSDSIEIRAG
ncbi:hypothetical protein CEE44_04135 [Candidatus Woesearchaeota archaeon B3_Woes]|nr:MAG: hypothetical protein CEE44_04135 [Candidatus Woesearchaeota archaeon B3_Woes]